MRAEQWTYISSGLEKNPLLSNAAKGAGVVAVCAAVCSHGLALDHR